MNDEKIILNVSLSAVPFRVCQLNLVDGKLQLTLQAEFSPDELTAIFTPRETSITTQKITAVESENLAPEMTPEKITPPEKTVIPNIDEPQRYGEPTDDIEFSAALNNTSENETPIESPTESPIEEIIDDAHDISSSDIIDAPEEEVEEITDDEKVIDESEEVIDEAIDTDLPTDLFDEAESSVIDPIDNDNLNIDDDEPTADLNENELTENLPIDEPSTLLTPPTPPEIPHLETPPTPSAPMRVRYVCPKCQTPGTQIADKIKDIITCTHCGRAMRLTIKS